MKKLLTLLFLLLLAWLAAGTWYYARDCGESEPFVVMGIPYTLPFMNQSEAVVVEEKTPIIEEAKPIVKPIIAVPLQISDGADLNVRLSDNVVFGESKSQAKISADVQNAYDKVAKYLIENPEKTLTLTGHYATSEQNSTSFPNLGLARANEVKNVLQKAGVKAERIKISALNDKNLVFGGEENVIQGGIDYKFATMPKPKVSETQSKKMPLVVRLDSALNVSIPTPLQFKHSDFEIKQPISPQMLQANQQIAQHLKKNADKRLKVTGFYTKSETNKSLLPNLGLARANNIKKNLTALGLENHQLEVAALEKPDLFLDADSVLTNAFQYEIVAMPEKAKREAEQKAKLAAIAAKIKGKPHFLYFETGATTLSLNDEVRQYFSDLIYYLDHNKDAKVAAVGHTDNVGGAAENMKYGQGRADFVKNYMTKNGLQASQIETASKGQTAPIADNKTEAGKAKNRRVEIRLK
jgi:outer membrane protein OmpA-like peptidoglycan-associated protein